MTRVVSRDYDDSTTRDPSWWAEIGGEGPKPYEIAAWTCTTVVVEEEEEEDPCDSEISGDRDDLSCGTEALWWQEIGGEGPKPYNYAAWTSVVTLVEEVDEASEQDSIANEAFTATSEWWESLGGDGPKPYEYAAWTFTTSVIAELLEFVAISNVVYVGFDEGYFNETPGGVVLDSGYLGQVRPDTYDETFFTGEERGELVKRTISRLMVYDSRASSPGNLDSILQPVGTLASDPVEAVEELSTDPLDDSFVLFESSGLIETDPSSEALSTDPDSDQFEAEELTGSLGIDPLATTKEITTDPSDDFIELTRRTTLADDNPPGLLLGSVSFETFNGVLTITDWEHLNWEDDTPVLKGVQTLLSQVPEDISEIRVLDPPHAFWTSLGFSPNHKGDPYLHIHL